MQTGTAYLFGRGVASLALEVSGLFQYDTRRTGNLLNPLVSKKEDRHGKYPQIHKACETG